MCMSSPRSRITAIWCVRMNGSWLCIDERRAAGEYHFWYINICRKNESLTYTLFLSHPTTVTALRSSREERCILHIYELSPCCPPEKFNPSTPNIFFSLVHSCVCSTHTHAYITRVFWVSKSTAMSHIASSSSILYIWIKIVSIR